MPLISTTLGDAPEKRLALYRQHRVPHNVLLLPFDSLSRLQRDAALHLASEWGGELAEVDTARRDLAHADPDERDYQLAGLWLVRLLDGPIHLLDAQHWMDEVEKWKTGEGTDPRLFAFRDAWNEAIQTYGPAPPPGPNCACPTCKRTYKKRKGKRR